jgi:Zn-dependent oligopeptidase
MFKTILQKIKELNNKQNFINKFKLKEIKIGTDHLYSGGIYAPYISLQITPVLQDANFRREDE